MSTPRVSPESSTLLPCPFCTSETVQCCYGLGATYLVECQSCETSGPRATDKATAIDAWNRRASVAQGRVPKVRTSHHRNKEEAARLQALVDQKYTEPAQTVGWRCFHCDEVFTDPKAAANHFGVDHVGDETLCQMAQVDGGIAKVIADLAEELQRYRSEDNTSYREFYALGADHRAALIREEQKGYDRGLADARAEACSDSSTLRVCTDCGQVPACDENCPNAPLPSKVQS